METISLVTIQRLVQQIRRM